LTGGWAAARLGTPDLSAAAITAERYWATVGGGEPGSLVGIRTADQESTMKNGADQTAVGAMVIVAAEQYEPSPLIYDPWAKRLLPLSGRIAAGITWWSPARRAMIAAAEMKWAGGWASVLCRKRYIDDQLVNAAIRGIDAVVILGASYDTRAYRVPEIAEIPVWEVDLPTNVTRKAAALRRCFGRVPPGVTLLPVDFETDNLGDRLDSVGYVPGSRTFFIWEAVTQYLTESAVRKTLQALADAAPGSALAFTFIRNDFLDGIATYGAQTAYQDFVVKRRLWEFGLQPEQVAGFLAEYGWHEAEQVGPGEYHARYLQLAGRNTRASEIERAVYAER
jgi:methyltransferase (TIGR00027 family)